MTRVMPHGTWPSPIDGGDLAAAGHRHGDLVVDGTVVWFTRTEPATGGMRLHRWVPGDPSPTAVGNLDVRSRVHEYGGGAIMVGHGRVVVAEFASQRLHVVDEDGSSWAVTPASDAMVRFAGGSLVDADHLVAVREVHTTSGAAADVVNDLVMVDLRDGTVSVLATGHDFFGDPVPGPDGWLTWATWDHPHMPWDETQLWVARLAVDQVDLATGDGPAWSLDGVHLVAGGDGVSVADWTWWGDDLVWADDRTGWWEVRRIADMATAPHPGPDEPLTSAGVDLGLPRWTHGSSSLAAVGDTLMSVGVPAAHGRLGIVADGQWTPVSDTEVVVHRVVAMADGVVTMDMDRDGTQVLRHRGLHGQVRAVVDTIPSLLTRQGDVPTVVPVSAPVEDGVTHGFLYLPANADVVAPVDALPPLLVFVHGGPTAHRGPSTSAAIAFWTTRGFAVVDCNYRGSTGHGRAYRRLMRGRWGEIEVADVIAMAGHLAAQGVVDGHRMAIRGGSAGGFTALAAVTQPDHPFACATSFYGVADLAALAADTHKFESRYLDSMVGPLPAAGDLYEQRSPITNVDNLAVPLLVLQGLDDKVVPPAQSEAMVAGAAERGVPHAYIAFEGEGHGFRHPDHIVTWLRSELAFYGEVMGFTPAGDLPTILDAHQV